MQAEPLASVTALQPGKDQVAAARRDLVHGFGVLGRHGLGAKIAGHLTHRHPDGRAFWTHCFGLGFEEIGADDLILADLDLNVLEGAGTINPTLHIHAQIYKVRPDVAAIAHTHGVHIVSLSATDADFLPCSQMAGMFQDDIGFFDEKDLIVLEAEQGAAMAAVIGGNSALVLRNHGSLMVGASMAEVVLKTLALEEAAEVQLKAMAAGGARAMSRAAAGQVKRFVLSPAIVQAYWDYEVRQLAKAAPGPAA